MKFAEGADKAAGRKEAMQFIRANLNHPDAPQWVDALEKQSAGVGK